MLLSAGCDQPDITKPEPLIPEDTYIDLLAEMQLIRVWHSTNPDSINADSLTGLVYNRYSITEEQFLQSHRYYEQFIKEQQDRVSKAINRLDEEIQSIENQEVEADSVETSPDSTVTE